MNGDGADDGGQAVASSSIPPPLDWKFSQVFGERMVGEEVQEEPPPKAMRNFGSSTLSVECWWHSSGRMFCVLSMLNRAIWSWSEGDCMGPVWERDSFTSFAWSGFSNALSVESFSGNNDGETGRRFCVAAVLNNTNGPAWREMCNIVALVSMIMSDIK